ncbi:uncharacterized protein LOC114732195 [Neltuma alba]|uniref:uncharacterized protein LOC114724244 n=1 Tax=Neltuma alba TaxID=207710 RepID=UPI0010A53929|nr:uncharacterized protein LOC114724244 [Prosopis alba]XP_028775320.1 uncharacterized protein LOC114732195 [Prosopis alba]
MAVSAASNVAGWSFRLSGRASPRKKLSRMANYIYPNRIRFSGTRWARSFVVRALDPQRGSNEAEENSRNSTRTFLSSEDWGYLAKLLAGSVLGAAAIKYGSAVYPVITRPNIVQALFMILTPVVVAVFLLIKESNLDTED